MRALCLLVPPLLVVATRNSARLPPAEGDGRVVADQPASPGQFPYQALVVGDQSYLCGGSLITPSMVLTAAHCTVGLLQEMHCHSFREFFIRLGGIYLDKHEETAWTAVTSWALPHPDYDKVFYTHDVAIILLLKRAPINYYINVVALPRSVEINNSFTGETAFISGWGRTSNAGNMSMELLWARLQVVPNTMLSMFFPPGYIVASTLCAVDRYSGFCGGDSGGALVLRLGRRFKQVGVNSFTEEGGCETAAPNAFVRVTSVLDWISRIAYDSR